MTITWSASDLESISCDLCGSAWSARTYRRGDGLSVAVCRCGLGYLSPRPRPALIERLYDQSYFSGGTAGIGYSSYLDDSRRLAVNPDALHNTVVREIDLRYGLKGKHLLDVGAATGILLSLAREKGARVLGVEPSAEAAQAGHELFGVEIRPGYLSDVELPPASFDIVTMLEVIEHPPSPRELLREAKRVLKPGGILVVSTPNFGMERYWGARYLGFQCSYEHLYYWTSRSLTAALEAEGFSAEAFAGTNWRFIQQKPGESWSKRTTRRLMAPAVIRLPRDLSATTLIAFARRS